MRDLAGTLVAHVLTSYYTVVDGAFYLAWTKRVNRLLSLVDIFVATPLGFVANLLTIVLVRIWPDHNF